MPYRVPVLIDGEDRGLSYQILLPITNVPVAYCAADCRLRLAPGRYDLEVRAPEGLRGGKRRFEVLGPSRLVVDAPPSWQRGTGLGMAITGHVLQFLGMILVITNVHIDSAYDEDDDPNKVVAGLAAMAVGTAAAPIGWVLFARGRGPDVEVVTPTPRAAATSWLALPVASAGRAMGPGVSFRF